MLSTFIFHSSVRIPLTLLFLMVFVFGRRTVEAEELVADENRQAFQMSPKWLTEEPIVVVGNWDSAPIFRRRKGGNPLWAEELYARAHTEEAVIRLKELGATLAIIHFYKGFGLEAEKQQLGDAKKLAALCKKHGLRVGVYIGSTIGYETLLAEVPEAEEWFAPNYRGQRITYHGTQTFRRRPYFMHPGFIAYMKRVVRIAVEDLQVDLIHFDNTSGRGRRPIFFHPLAIEDFREFLLKKYTPEQRKRRIGFAVVSHIDPPMHDEPLMQINDPLFQEWTDFRCQQITEFYGEMTRYIRGLNPQVAVDNNPHSGLSGENTMWEQGVDYPRLLANTDVVWTEELSRIGVTEDGVLVSRIRSFKQATGLGNAVFTYTGDALLEMAESLAFNRRCLGMVGGMLAGYQLSDAQPPGAKDNPYTWGGERPGFEMTRRKKDYIDFFHKNFSYYRDAETVANVAILRSYATMAYSNARPQQSTYLFEQALIQAKVPFDIVFDKHLSELSKYRVLVLADQEAMSDQQIEQIRTFVHSGGGLVATEHTSLYDEHRRRRKEFGLGDLFEIRAPRWPAFGAKPEPIVDTPTVRRQIRAGRVVYLPEIIPTIDRLPDDPMDSRYWRLPKNAQQLIDAVRWAASDELPLKVDAPPEVVAELVSSDDRDALVLHLVNYGSVPYPKLKNIGSAHHYRPPKDTADRVTAIENIKVRLRIPRGKKIQEVVLLSPDGQQKQNLAYHHDEQHIKFTVPHLLIYDLVIARFD